MKNAIVFISAIILTAAVANAAYGTIPGAGTADDPYLIEDFDDFQTFCGISSYWYSGKHTRLDCNLDLDPNLPNRQTYTQAPIAYDTNNVYSGFQGTGFSGFFDGSGHIIKNLTIDGADYCGFFGKLTSSSEVKNLKVEDVSIAGSGDNVGALVGWNDQGNITNSYSTGAISGENSVGGLAGMNEGNISGSYSTGMVTGQVSVGGLVGQNEDGSITGSYSTGEVTGEYSVGGLVGRNSYGNSDSIADSYSTGMVTGQGYVGGLVGSSSCTITSSYSTGAVIGNDYVGGLVGKSTHYIINSYSSGAISGNDNVGGLVGQNMGYITSSYSTGEVTGNNYIGGLVGVGSNGHVTNSYSTGEITGDNDIGGLMGKYYGSISYFTNCFWDVETSGIGSSGDEIFGAIGKTTSQMQTLSTFTDGEWTFADFQIGSLGWFMHEGNYPQLYWQNPEAALIPDVTNMTLPQAQTSLTKSGLTSVNIINVNSWQTPEGSVAGISVPIGGSVYRSKTIDIYVSNGSSGDGSPENPYEIAGKTDLLSVASSDSAQFIMTADIHLEHHTELRGTLIPNLRGLFDGNGHIINNMILNAGDFKLSFIGNCFGQVKNLGLENVNVRGETAVGGLCGINRGTITNCYVTGFVGGSSGTGGLCGMNSIYTEADYGTINNCYSTAEVRGWNYSSTVGGLVGDNNGTITDSYSTGAVSASNTVGGLVGNNNSGSISNCYSTGAVTGSDRFGGLVGWISNPGIIINCFWDVETSGIGLSGDDNFGATGKTTEQMQTLSTFTDAGWDFVGESANGSDNLWRLCEDGVGYPRLAWEYSRIGDFACTDGVDQDDLAVLAIDWLVEGRESSADANFDGIVNFKDMAIVAENWLR